MLYCSIVLTFVLQGFVIRHYDELCSASRIGILVSLIIVFQQEFNALFSFIDDIALQTKSPRTLHKILHFLFTEGPLYGLSFIASKSELDALNNAPHVTILPSSSRHFSTFDNSGNPRVFINIWVLTSSTKGKIPRCTNSW